MKLTIAYLTIFLPTLLFGQEHLSNGGFEKHIYLPNDYAQSKNCIDWNELNQEGYKTGSPDYFFEGGSFSASQLSVVNILPHSDSAVMGLYCYDPINGDFREYISSKLTRKLVKGGVYEVSFWITNGEKIDPWKGYSSNGIGFLFTKNVVTQTNAKCLNRIPQILIKEQIWSESWIKYSFEFMADSSYEYLTIGGFLDENEITIEKQMPDAQVGVYYFFDDISVYRTDPYIEGDTLICKGELANLTAYNLENVQWIDRSTGKIMGQGNNLNISLFEDLSIEAKGSAKSIYHSVKVISPHGNFLPSDTSLCSGVKLILRSPISSNITWSDGSKDDFIEVDKTGFYWLQIAYSNCISNDSIFVKFKFCDCHPIVPNSFSPNSDGLNDFFEPIISCPVISYHLSIFNKWGELMFESFEQNNLWDGKVPTNREYQTTYSYKLEYELGDGSINYSKGLVNVFK